MAWIIKIIIFYLIFTQANAKIINGYDFSPQTVLNDIDFSNQEIIGKNINYSQIKNSIFSNAIMMGSHFDYSDLSLRMSNLQYLTYKYMPKEEFAGKIGDLNGIS
jgi:uncharacterized protein YjbI with pentapeptide repeats